MTTLKLGALALALLAGTAGLIAPVEAAAQTAAQAALTARADGMDVRSGALVMRVTALTDSIVRVRIGRDGTLPEDASWAVLPAMRAAHATVTSAPDGFATAALTVRIDPATLALTVTDRAGKVIVADDPRPIKLDGRAFTLRKALPLGQHIFGLGDKTGGTLDRRGSTYVDWNTDSYAFTSSTDPIYKSIPFFIDVGGEGGSYGLLLDNTWRAAFDFGHVEANTIQMAAPDGPIDYYVIAGPTTREVVRRYTDLTGKAPLPPQWALGYQQSRYSYMSADETRQVAATLRAVHIPTDVMWLDIDYQDRNRPFTVNTQTFPDLKGLVGDLGREGIKLVTITDLHVADAPDQGYAPYDTGMAGNHFVHNPDGSVFVGKVWPGPSVFPDFTDKSARTWWGTNFKTLVADGVAGFWNDMDEPSVFNDQLTMPLDTVHRIDSDDFRTRTATHAEIHNVFGLENTRATYDGQRTLAPDERGFVMTRASYAGGQRYAVTWTGDNSATWDHLKLSIHQLINLGLSGFSYAGADVGGFTGGPSPELLTRWFEIGAFTPVFRDHSAKGTPRAEPWVDGPEQLAIRRRYVEERYRLLPYLYALADGNARTGDPLMRPVFYDYPDAIDVSCDHSSDFTLGAALMIAPPPKMESPQAYEVCLPKGEWYDYWTGKPVAASAPLAAGTPADEQGSAASANGATRITETPRLDYLPIFVRAGTILPRQPLVQSTAETPNGPLSLDIYPGPDCTGTLYLDDGHSMAFARGQFLRQALSCQANGPGGLTLSVAAQEGRYRPWWKSFAVTVHGRTAAARVTLAGRAIPARFDAETGTLSFEIPASAKGGVVSIAG